MHPTRDLHPWHRLRGVKGSAYPTDTGTFWELGIGFLPFQGQVWVPQAEQTRGGVLEQGMSWDCQALGEVLQPHSPQGPGADQECGTLSTVPARLSPSLQV